MARIDFDNRIQRLAKRRKGGDKDYNFADILNEGTVNYSEFAKLKAMTERWETASTRPSVRYALGAMQEVDKRYTEISIETAKRIENQLIKRLPVYGLNTEYKLQGSVPLNIHIKGVSDVDMLVIDKSHHRSEPYINTLMKDDIEVLKKLRNATEYELKCAYPSVKVDTKGDKAIKLTGGSLPRDVDVVPAHWVETNEYIKYKLSYDRGINILNKSIPSTFLNLPFKHIQSIEKVCIHLTEGSLRKSIRLCKNIKADLIAEGRSIYLTSYDLASIMYYADKEALKLGKTNALAIVRETQRLFDYLYNNQIYAKAMTTPDGTRRIFDSSNKIDSLLTMSVALDNLVDDLINDLGFYIRDSLKSYGLSI